MTSKGPRVLTGNALRMVLDSRFVSSCGAMGLLHVVIADFVAELLLMMIRREQLLMLRTAKYP